MKTSRCLHALLLAIVLAGAPCAGHATVIVDQQNPSTSVVGADYVSLPGTTVGESFIPSQPSIQAVTFALFVVASTSTVRVDLLTGAGLDGAVLASTPTVTLTSSNFQTKEFDFASVQLLVPGSTYTLRIVETAGNEAGAFVTNDTYANGIEYSSGHGADTAVDLIFAEGAYLPATGVPEPSAWALLVTGGIGVALLGLRNHSRAQLAV